MIDIQKLYITKDQKTIIHSASHNFPSKKSTVIIGENGAGKTCLLHTITGNIIPQSGSITIQTKHIGYCSDTGGINPDLTPQEQRDLTQKIAKRSQNKKDIDTRIEKLHLITWIHQKISTLSKGNQQKVGLINSIIHDPLLVIWDEPTQHLDPSARHVVHQLINDLKAKGKTILYSTHFLEDIGNHTDEYVIIEKGYIASTGKIGDGKIDTFFK